MTPQGSRVSLMQKLGKKTVILQTHDATVATELFDDVIVVTDSEVILKEITSHGGPRSDE
jgi:3-deoxy-manno-octulosonate cytidylyltransferase (CMP-KDO synthetase)